MQESAIGMRALAFHIGKEIAAQLVAVRHAHHRRIGHRLALGQRQAALDPQLDAIAPRLAGRERMLEAEVVGAGHHWRTGNRAHHFGALSLGLQQVDTRDVLVLLECGDRHDFAQIIRTLALHPLPLDAQVAVGIAEGGADGTARHTFGFAGRLGVGLELALLRRRQQLQLRGVELAAIAIGEHERLADRDVERVDAVAHHHVGQLAVGKIPAHADGRVAEIRTGRCR